jgi:cytochrome c oxidase subunit 5b
VLPARFPLIALPSCDPGCRDSLREPPIANRHRATEIKTSDDLFAPGAKPGTVPTDIEQATGLERLEILGKMQGVDIFDMRPLDASRLGTSRRFH